MMLSGAMHNPGTEDESIGWQEVARWMDRLQAALDGIPPM